LSEAQIKLTNTRFNIRVNSMKFNDVIFFRSCNNSTLNTTTGSVQNKKFDLQASLSKPLSYKPHKGKLIKFPYLKHDSKIPVRVAKQPLPLNHKKDVKSVKVTTRYETSQNLHCSGGLSSNI